MKFKAFLKNLAAVFLISLIVNPSFAYSTGGCWLFGLQGGNSISTPMDFQPDYDQNNTRATWTVPESSSFNNRTINSSPFFGISTGYQINPILSLDVNYAYRGDYEWENQFSIIENFPDQISFGERYLLREIKINTALLEMNLAPKTCWCGVRPFGTAGLGVGWIKTGTLRNFEIENVNAPFRGRFDTRVAGKTKSSFAWEIGAGLDYEITCCAHIIMGYRFVNIRAMETSNIATDEFIPLPSFTIPPFKARNIQFHEPYIGVTFHI